MIYIIAALISFIYTFLAGIAAEYIYWSLDSTTAFKFAGIMGFFWPITIIPYVLWVVVGKSIFNCGRHAAEEFGRPKDTK